ncbi:MAG: hypothetical protein CM1200mP41_30820 [Gammaproteobacteria bacterium]|nr:MAG: hypothetical protein CM1200mP41_30820 [Gammaproteobacteria bacterium]
MARFRIFSQTLSAYVKNRRGYDYSKHGQSDNPYLDFITPDVVESFAVLGSVEQHIDKLRQLEAEVLPNSISIWKMGTKKN